MKLKLVMVLGGAMLIFAGGWMAGQLPITAQGVPQLVVLTGAMLNIAGAIMELRRG